MSPSYTHIDTNGNGIIEQGEQIKFGKYPQTKVTDTTLIETLNTKAGTLPVNGSNGTWTSYKYYQYIRDCDEDGYNCSWDNITNDEDYMWYQDIEENGEKYRGVYFTSYRPYVTYAVIAAANSDQDDNGYYINNVYWFKYEDIVWDVGRNENSEVTLISHTILDSREFYINSEEERTIDGVTVYANNYEHSTIRAWLNETFYNTAFTRVKEQNASLLREVDNSAATTDSDSNPYASNNTNDKIFLLSYKDINENATTYNITLGKQGSDYAKAQGLHVDTNTYAGNSYYWLRSPYDFYGYSYCVCGMFDIAAETVETFDGTVVALKIGL